MRHAAEHELGEAAVAAPSDHDEIGVDLVGDAHDALSGAALDGTIELERLDNVLHVGRPAFGQENSTVGIFKIDPDGAYAVRTQVKLGRSSVNFIEIVSGLKEGDRVILSDTSQWDANDRIRLK